jgi:hypothetical protein
MASCLPLFWIAVHFYSFPKLASDRVKTEDYLLFFSVEILVRERTTDLQLIK